MKAIWKYPITSVGSFTVNLPKSAQFLCVQTQHGTPQMWWIVDVSRANVKTELRRFTVLSTGEPFDDAVTLYRGTFQLDEGALVFHLFEP